MGGMGEGDGINVNDPTVVAAFHRLLLQGGLVVLALAVLVFVVWRWARRRQLSASGSEPAAGPAGAAVTAAPMAVFGEARPAEWQEPPGRRLLRIGFGVLWIFDGVLQGQSSMPLGLIPQVVRPAAESSPAWVRHLVASASGVWTYHPAAAAAATVWIQLGVGLFLLVGGPGTWSRLAGVVSAGWGLLVWVFGEAFGGVFGSGLSLVFGFPGAAFIYVVAGALVALPEKSWASARLGRRLLGAVGAFLIGTAVLQAWPGRGFWQGAGGGNIDTMAHQMAETPQPRLLAVVVDHFAGFDDSHGWAVNLFLVLALASVGAAMASGRRRVVAAGVSGGIVVFLAAWVLIQDLGFMGGVGTDPNSMLLLALLVAGAWLAWAHPGAEPAACATAWPLRLRREPAFALRTATAAAAVGVILVGAAPMALAATHATADTDLAAALAGPPELVDRPAPAVALTDQMGRRTTLSASRGRAVLLTFLDPVCTTDCPLVGRELRAADRLLGTDASRVRIVAVNANPVFTGTPFLDAFDRQEGLAGVANWEFLTGTAPELRSVWAAFGMDVETGVGGSMMSHSDVVFVIDPAGRLREIIDANPGPGTPATMSSFAQFFADAAERVLHR